MPRKLQRIGTENAIATRPQRRQRFGTEVATASRPKALARLLAVPLLLAALAPLPAQDLLGRLGERQNFGSKRISSFDRTGGNRDSLTIEPGKTVELAAIRGPGGHPPHLDDDRGRAVLRAEDRPPLLLGRRGDAVRRGARRRLLRRRPRPQPEPGLPPDREFLGGPRPELLLAHALPLVVPGHRDQRGERARRRVLLLHRLPRARRPQARRPLLPRPVPPGIPLRGGPELSPPRRRGKRPFRRLEPERPPEGHGLVGRGRRHDLHRRRDGALAPRHGLGGLLFRRLGDARGREPVLRVPPSGGGFPGRFQGLGLPVPCSRPRRLQEVHPGDHRARARQRPRGRFLVGGLLVPDRAPRSVSAPAARRQAPPLRAVDAGGLRVSRMASDPGGGRGLRRVRGRAPGPEVLGAQAVPGGDLVLQRAGAALSGARHGRRRLRHLGRDRFPDRGRRALPGRPLPVAGPRPGQRQGFPKETESRGRGLPPDRARDVRRLRRRARDGGLHAPECPARSGPQRHRLQRHGERRAVRVARTSGSSVSRRPLRRGVSSRSGTSSGPSTPPT